MLHVEHNTLYIYMGIWDGLGSSAASAAGGLISTGLSALTAGSSARRQYKFQKKLNQQQFDYNKQLMEQQNKYAQQNYDQQRKDYLSDSVTSGWRERQNLLGAGKSLSFGEGYSPAQPLGASPELADAASVSNGSVSAVQPHVADFTTIGSTLNQAFLLKAQKDNIEADTWKKEHEASLVSVQTQRAERELQMFNDTYDQQIDQLRSTIANLQADSGMKESTDFLNQSLMRLNNAKAQLTFYDLEHVKPLEVKRLSAQVLDTLAHISVNTSQASLNDAMSKLTNIKSSFAEIGLGIGSNMVDSVLAMLSAPKGGEIFTRVSGNIQTLFKSIADAFSSSEDDDKSFRAFIKELSHNRNMQRQLERHYNGDYERFYTGWKSLRK